MFVVRIIEQHHASGCAWRLSDINGDNVNGLLLASLVARVSQSRIYTPYMTVCLMISLPEIPYIHRIYMVLANPTTE